MATFRYSLTGVPDYLWWPDLISTTFYQEQNAVDTTSTTYSVIIPKDEGEVQVLLTGTGFGYFTNEGSGETRPIDGTVTTMTISQGEQTLMTVTGLSTALADIEHFWAGFGQGDPNSPNSNYHYGDTFNLFTFLMNGNDKIYGSNNSDDIIAGRNPGNDSIYGLGGEDFIKADMGNDLVSGGTGYDTYTLQESFYDDYAKRGANVNLATGVATDCWGGKDKLQSIEEVRGSRFGDTFTGSAASNTFAGLKGRDVIDGGKGFDTVRYDRDERLGGLSGVTVNLTTGVARDGWGNTDTLKNIESVRGTNYSDTMTGNASANNLFGGLGDDTLSGGGGADVLTGGGGGDRMTGGAGVDDFIFAREDGNDPWGDTITDFTSGTDHLFFETATFDGMDQVLRLVNGTAATASGSTFIFDTATKALYWDADGSGDNTAIQVATLTGVTSLTTADIILG